MQQFLNKQVAMSQTITIIPDAHANEVRFKPDSLLSGTVGRKTTFNDRNGSRVAISMAVGADNFGSTREMIVHESLASDLPERPREDLQ